MNIIAVNFLPDMHVVIIRKQSSASLQVRFQPLRRLLRKCSYDVFRGKHGIVFAQHGLGLFFWVMGFVSEARQSARVYAYMY